MPVDARDDQHPGGGGQRRQRDGAALGPHALAPHQADQRVDAERRQPVRRGGEVEQLTAHRRDHVRRVAEPVPQQRLALEVRRVRRPARDRRRRRRQHHGGDDHQRTPEQPAGRGEHHEADDDRGTGHGEAPRMREVRGSGQDAVGQRDPRRCAAGKPARQQHQRGADRDEQVLRPRQVGVQQPRRIDGHRGRRQQTHAPRQLRREHPDEQPDEQRRQRPEQAVDHEQRHVVGVTRRGA